MSTFGQMVTDIADDLNKTNLNPQIKRQIVAAMKAYRHKRFKFNYSSSTFTTSDGQSVYPLPEGYMGDEVVEVLDGSFKDDLTKRDYAWIVANDTHDSYESEPRVYAIIDGDNARLFPVPDQEYTLIWNYHKDLNAPGISGAITACATDGVTNAWMTDGFELIKLEAEIRVYMNVLRGQGSAQEAAKLVPLRDAALKGMIKEYQQAVGSGSVQGYFGKR